MNLPRRSRGDDGAVLVEAAIVLPVLFMIVFGILEIGGLLKSYSAAANGVRAGGRMASVAGNDAMADKMILERIAQEAGGLGDGEIEYVIIWNATGEGDTPPAGCIQQAGAALVPNNSSLGVYDGGQSTVGACNVYVRPSAPAGAFDMALGLMGPANPPEKYFGCSGPAPANNQKVDCYWAPQNRKVQVSPRVLPPGVTESQRVRPDFVGVHIRATHEYYTGVVGDTLTITDNGINLLEPDTFGVRDAEP